MTPNRSRRFPSRWFARKGNIAAVAAGLAVVAYVCSLLVSNYHAQRTLRSQLLLQFQQETATRATTIEYIVSTARGSVANLAAIRALQAYFENRDLGMSADYGLNQSLVPVRERVLDTLQKIHIGPDRLFERIVIVDGRGKPLVDVGDRRPGEKAPWVPFATAEYRQGPIVAYSGGGTIVVSHPYAFKGRYEGQIVAWLGERAIFGTLARAEGDANHILAVGTSVADVVKVSGAAAPSFDLSALPPIESLSPGEIREFRAGAEGSATRLVACRRPVPGTPLSVVQVSEAANLLGRLNPLEQALRMAVAALALLGGAAYVLFVGARSRALEEDLDISLLREKEIQRKNEQLEVEIAERKRAEKAQARLGMAVEQADEVIVITDPDGTIVYVNPAFERVTGFSREEAIGNNPRVLKSGRHDEAFYRNLWDTLTQGESWRGTFVNRRKDGTFYDEVAVISPVRDAGGAIVNYVAVKRDVTREMQIEEHHRQVQRLESIGKLAGGIAHDFNNLLTVINGYGEILLRRSEIAAAARGEIEEIAKAGRQAAALTRQLLAFSRKQMLQPRLLDLNSVTANMEKMLRRLIGENIELITVAGKELGSVKVDPGQIEQVIMNLVVNARDAMPEGGKVIIETRNVEFDAGYVSGHPVVRPGPYVMLAVSDTGRGMDEATLARVFEPFFTTKELGKGTGLGLSTVYGIVKQSQGYVWGYSETGRGATFKVYLPRVFEVQDESGAPSRAAGAPTGGSETILLAEDEDLVRELARTVLRKSGYRVLCARDGGAALAIAAHSDEPIHLLITDVVMPQMSGKELANRIARVRPGIRVLFMSGYTENAIVHQGVLDPGTDFIPKPFQVEHLARKVREVLDRGAGLPLM